MEHHPVLELEERHLDFTVPFTVHMDDASSYCNRSCNVISWKSMLANGFKFESRILFSSMMTEKMTETTHRQLFQVLQWSFCALLDGRWPQTCHLGFAFKSGQRLRKAGTCLAGPWRAALNTSSAAAQPTPVHACVVIHI